MKQPSLNSSIRLRITIQGVESGLVIAVCILYGFLSSPTPDNIGIAELLIGVFLLGLVGATRALSTLNFLERGVAPRWVKLLAVYLLLFPTIVGLVIHQNEVGNFVRDFIPLIYMLMPLFLYSRIKKAPDVWVKVLAVGLLFAGVGFTFQYYSDPLIAIEQLAAEQLYGSNKDNPWQDPAAVFAFSLSLLATMHFVFNARLIPACLSGVIFVAMLGMYLSTVSRAPIGLSLLAGVFFVFISWRASAGKQKRRLKVGLMVLVAVLAITIFSFLDLLQAAFDMLLQKTENVGFSNARDIEMLAVFANAAEKPFVLVFGEGWGGLLPNPIGGGVQWRFVHNSFFYFLFKAGIIGFLAYGMFLFWCLNVFRSLLFWRERNIFYALILVSTIAALVVAVLLEAAFKTLTFGLLLSLVLAIQLAIARNPHEVIYPSGRGW